MLPIVDGLQKDYQGRVTFQRVNILNPKNKSLMEQYGFTTAPELYLVDESNHIVGSWDDFVDSKTLRQAFDQALKKAAQ